MKKLFIAALALTAFTACSQDELVEQQQSTATIAFDGAFVDNATRAAEDPSITTATINAFDVWGFMDSTDGNVFNQQRVTKNGNSWTYSPLQYWLPGHTYYFGALAPVAEKNWTLDTNGANVNGIGTVTFKNINGTEDLLYAATSVDTHNKTLNDAYAKVGLTFNHLLSKVKFSFTNGFDAPNYTITVTDIKMEVPGDGSINLAQADWWSTNQWNLGQTTTTLEFGDMDVKILQVTKKAESEKERLTIPANAEQEYIVTFDVELFSGAVSAFKNTLTTTIKGAALEIGKAYNFHAILDETNIAGVALKPIEFELIEVKEWVDGNGYDGGVISTNVAGIKSVEEFTAAMNAGKTNFKLLDNITGTLTFGDAATGRSVDGKEFVLDLNGKTLENTSNSSEYGTSEAIVAYSNLTINGEGTVIGNTRAVWARGEDNVVVTINGGTYKGAKEGYANGGCSVIYASSNNTINIYGGTFEALSADKSSYANKNGVWAALNVYDNAGYINVYGGKFIKFNPAVPGTEPQAWIAAHPNGFVADGYASIQEGNDFVVVPAIKEFNVATAEELFLAVNEGGVITLTADITVSSPVIINSGKVVTLNLNEKTLTNKLENQATDVIIVEEGATLTIYGKNGDEASNKGIVEAVTGNDGYAIISEGTLIIKNGTFKSGHDEEGAPNAVIYARGNGKVYVEGGYFPNDDQSKYVLNKKDQDRDTTVIEVKGGHFYYFNPGNNAAEGAKTNFLAEGYNSAGQGDRAADGTYTNYKVYKNK